MNFRIYLKIFLYLFTFFFFYSCKETPDAIYINGKFYTLNDNNTVVEAIAVKEGKILDLGSTRDITDKYKSEDIIDLKGATVLPGFIDCEGSIIEFSKNLNLINLSFVKSIEEIKKLVLDKVRTSKEDEWIAGYGWSELNIPESELEQMNKSILDQIAPGNNVYLLNLSGNTLWVNSRLLRTLKIDKNTPSPPNGEIEVDENGELTGILYDDAVNLVKDKLPALSKTDITNAVEKGVKEILKYGITEVHDRTVNEEAIGIFRDLINNKKFPIRVYAILSGEDSVLINSFLNKGTEVNYNDKLTIRAISLDYDGAFELQDAAMNDKYKEEPKRKVPYVQDADIERIFTKAIEKNFQFSIKSVGDRAIDSSLNILEKIIKQKNPKDNRTVIEYIEFINPKDLSKISELKLIPSVRPDICMNDIQIVSQIINPDNSKKIGLWNSLLKAAGMITTGSDFPFHQINPFIQIYYLTTRQLTDTVLASIPNPDQKLSLLDAVKSYTVWAAYSSFEEKIKGSLEKGKFADMIVISNDIFNTDSKALLNTQVLKTIINGRMVYENSSIKQAAGN